MIVELVDGELKICSFALTVNGPGKELHNGLANGSCNDFKEFFNK